MKPMAKLFAAAAFAACAATSSVAHAQDFPNKSIRIIVPYAPAGNIDITARTLAPAFGEALGQTIIVENRTGAGGSIGTGAVAKAAPDGQGRARRLHAAARFKRHHYRRSGRVQGPAL